MTKFKKEMLENMRQIIEKAMSTKDGSPSMSSKGGGPYSNHSFSAPSGLKISDKDRFSAMEGKGSGRRNQIDFATINEYGHSRNNNEEEDDELLSAPLSSRDATMISSLQQQLHDAKEENERLKKELLKNNNSNPNNR